MSDFLKKMYEEEMSKTGSAEFMSIMDALPKGELEAYLGLSKEAGGVRTWPRDVARRVSAAAKDPANAAYKAKGVVKNLAHKFKNAIQQARRVKE